MYPWHQDSMPRCRLIFFVSFPMCVFHGTLHDTRVAKVSKARVCANIYISFAFCFLRYWFVLMAQVYTPCSNVSSHLLCVCFSVVLVKWVGRSVMIEVTAQTRIISNWARACCFLWRIGAQRGNIVYSTPLHVQTNPLTS